VPGAEVTIVGGSGGLPQVEEALETFMVAMSSAESFIVTSLARFGPGAYARPLFSST